MGKGIKIIIVVALLGVGIFVFYLIRKKQSSAANGNTIGSSGSTVNSGNTNGTTGSNTSSGNTTGTSGNNTTTQPVNDGSTISQAEALIRANNILVAMDKVGTDEKAIIDNLLGLNKADLLKVVTAFGWKPYYGTGLDDRTDAEKKSIFAVFAIKGEFDLYKWLDVELSRKAKEEVQAIFNKNGISF